MALPPITAGQIPPSVGAPQPVMRAPSTAPIADGYANPAGTSPAPAPLSSLRPVGYWEAGPLALSWTLQGTEYQALWSSPVFDLRTDLRGVASRELDGNPINRTAAAQMWIGLAGLSVAHLGMRVYMGHWGHPIDYNRVAQFVPWTDVTGDTATGLDLAILNYFPPGSGYQMRYWKVGIQLAYPVDLAPARLPTIQLSAGVY